MVIAVKLVHDENALTPNKKNKNKNHNFEYFKNNSHIIEIVIPIEVTPARIVTDVSDVQL